MEVDVRAPSPAMSMASDSDDDGVNTASAKVYIGPFLTPEKSIARRLQQSTLLGPTSPTSPTHSGAGTPREDEEEAESEVIDMLDLPLESSPVRRLWPADEPPSALASRIMRAHDNPSPPPRFIRPEFTDADRIIDDASIPLIHVNEDTTVQAQAQVVPESPPASVSSSSLTSSPESRIASPKPNHAETTAMPDLISFDKTVIIPQLDDDASTRPLNSQLVNDLLGDSPLTSEANSEITVLHSPTPIFPRNNSIIGSTPPPQPHLLSPSPVSLRRSPRLSALRLPSPNPIDLNSMLSKPVSPGPSDLKKRRRSRSSRSSGIFRLTSPSRQFPHSLDDIHSSDTDTSDSTMQGTSAGKAGRQRKRAKVELNDAVDRLPPIQSLPPTSEEVLPAIVKEDTEPATAMNTTSQPVPSPLPPLPESPTEPESSRNPDTMTLAESLVQQGIQRPPPGSPVPSAAAGPSSLPFQPSSPFKFVLKPTLHDPNRTPARRSPAPPAPVAFRGFVFHQPGKSPERLRTPVFSRPNNFDTNRTPARRPVSADSSTKTTTMRTPNRTLHPMNIHGRSASAEPPRSLAASAGPGLSQNTEMSSNSVEVRQDKTMSDLPASEKEPISDRQGAVGAVKPTAPLTTIAEVLHEASGSMPPQQPSVKPLPMHVFGKSSTAAGSKIPRPGALAKPTTSTKLPIVPLRKIPRPVVPPRSLLPSPVKPLPKPTSSISTSEQQTAPTATIAPNGHVPGPATSVTQGLKRKRPVTKVQPPVQSQKLMIRQVIPGMFGGRAQASPIPPGRLEHQPSPAPTNKVNEPKKGPIMARQVVKGMFANNQNQQGLKEANSECTQPLQLLKDSKDVPNLDPQAASRQPAPPCCTLTVEIDTTPETCMQVDRSPVPVNGQPAPGVGPESPSQLAKIQKTKRRTSRSRRAAGEEDDVFGIVGQVNLTPGTSRAKSVPKDLGSTFMSANALKSLTNTNTTKNQAYLAADLEMLIIKKSGNRPESPSTKLRTILEKRKENQGKERAARARRRRGEEDPLDDDSMSMDIDDSGVTKHMRGPGDEEDYETPLRPENGGKRVKWDPGLTKVAFIDEIEVKSNNFHRDEEVIRMLRRKSCLANEGKVVLDTLGNLVTVENPLELAQERVVVTKYVYDNDVEPVEVVPRTTRSKSKKNR